MITNFEEFTGELTEYDAEKVLPLLDYYISTVARGKDNSITNARLVELCASEGVKTSGPRVRKIIHEIRVRGIINNLLATSKGYYVSDDPDEVDVYIKSCKERISSIWSTLPVSRPRYPGSRVKTMEAPGCQLSRRKGPLVTRCSIFVQASPCDSTTCRGTGKALG